jgi:hypothetical protein
MTLEYQPPRKRSPNDKRYSILALVGFTLSFFGPCIATILTVPIDVANPILDLPRGRGPWILFGLPVLVGSICSAIALYQIIQAEGRLRGGPLACVGTFIGWVWLVCIVYRSLN